MDATIGDEALDGLFGDLAAVGSKPDTMMALGVVDDEIDAGRQLERTDASFAADDAAFEIVAEIDHRDGGLDRVLAALRWNGLGNAVLGAVDGRFARLVSSRLTRFAVSWRASPWIASGAAPWLPPP
jgi:hypothetical protein